MFSLALSKDSFARHRSGLGGREIEPGRRARKLLKEGVGRRLPLPLLMLHSMPLPQGSLYPTFQSILTFFWTSTPRRRWKSQAISRRQTYGVGLSYHRHTCAPLAPF